MSPSYHQAGCCCPAVPCEYCDTDTTPKRISVTITGASVCTGCQETSPVSSFAFKFTSVPSIDPNGTFVCVQTDDPCIWIYEVACTGQRGYYGSLCPGSPLVLIEFSTFRITLIKTSNTTWDVWIVFVFESHDYGSSVPACERDLIVLHDITYGSGDNDCEDTEVVNASHGGCAYTYGYDPVGPRIGWTVTDGNTAVATLTPL